MTLCWSNVSRQILARLRCSGRVTIERHLALHECHQRCKGGEDRDANAGCCAMEHGRVRLRVHDELLRVRLPGLCLHTGTEDDVALAVERHERGLCLLLAA